MSTKDLLLPKSSPPPVPVKNENVIVVVVVFIGLILSSVALFIAVNNYLIDRTDKTRIEAQQTRLTQIFYQNAQSQRTIQVLDFKESQLDDLNGQCSVLKTKLAQDFAQVASIYGTTFALYDSINATIMGQQRYCDRELLNLTTVLQQMLEPLVNNASVVSSGVCQWNSLVQNGTETVPFTYNVLNVNGLDFYFYSFGNSTNAVEASYGVRIERCSPILFRGVQQNLGPYQRYLNGFIGSPLSTVDYLSYLRVGEEYLELVPKSVPSVNQTMRIQPGFQLWLGLF